MTNIPFLDGQFTQWVAELIQDCNPQVPYQVSVTTVTFFYLKKNISHNIDQVKFWILFKFT